MLLFYLAFRKWSKNHLQYDSGKIMCDFWLGLYAEGKNNIFVYDILVK